jgi:peptide deformylase
MKSALSEQEDGVAIAAPQIAVEKRIFVLSPITYGKQHAGKDLVFINPVITKFSKEKEYMVEGCLSVRWLYGDVYRSKKVFIEYQDEHGNAKSLGASGLLAQIFQHECDHLDGVLFDSKAKNLEDLPPSDHTHVEISVPKVRWHRVTSHCHARLDTL